MTVPDPQVQLFLRQVHQAKETDSPAQEQDIRDAAKLLVYVAWEEVAHRQDRLNVGPPKFDPVRSEAIVQKGKDFKLSSQALCIHNLTWLLSPRYKCLRILFLR